MNTTQRAWLGVAGSTASTMIYKLSIQDSENDMKRNEYQRGRHTSTFVDECWQVILAIILFVNPLRGPGIVVALIATFVEEVGQDLPWYALVLICLTNLLAIRLVSLIAMEAVCC